MEKWYRILNVFDCAGKRMVTVKIKNNVHIMEYNEWKVIYGRNHPERWKKGNRYKIQQ